MKRNVHALAFALLLSSAALAQSAPSGEVRSALDGARDAQLLEQRAAGAALAEPVGLANREELRAEAARNADLAAMRAENIDDHDLGIILITVAVVVLIALLL